MTHKEECERVELVLEQRRVPETGRTVYLAKCRGCGAFEELTQEEADKRFQNRAGYFIPTRV